MLMYCRSPCIEVAMISPTFTMWKRVDMRTSLLWMMNGGLLLIKWVLYCASQYECNNLDMTISCHVQPTVADIEGRINNFIDVSEFHPYMGDTSFFEKSKGQLMWDFHRFGCPLTLGFFQNARFLNQSLGKSSQTLMRYFVSFAVWCICYNA